MMRDLERRRQGNLTDAQIDEVAERVAFILQYRQDEEGETFFERVLQRIESRMYEWLGRRALWIVLSLAGTLAVGSWAVVEWLKAWVKTQVGA